jgi:transcriptional regulator with XRE-family HTH domain
MADTNAAPDVTPPVLGQILRDARRRAGVSQRRLAIRTGIAAPSISRIENGPRVALL